ncbi:hypothetical protein [Ferrovum sp.]|uniref:hypothetical protein n=1 Tax=Ferrovum sp. TaxID=2609467 RepID=UPI00260A9E1E|nr:hypothetical protein [Ferrovum sp.]
MILSCPIFVHVFRTDDKPICPKCVVLFRTPASKAVWRPGTSWNGDGGTYRLGKGARIQAESVDRAIIGQVIKELQSDSIASAIAEHYRNLTKIRDKRPDEAGPTKRRISEIEKKISRLTELVAETRAPEALLRQIETMEDERTKLVSSLDNLESDRAVTRLLRNIDTSDIRRMLKGLAEDMNVMSPKGLETHCANRRKTFNFRRVP